MLSPTKERIFFAEYDVMKSVAASLTAAYGNRVRAATTEAERDWWDAKRHNLPHFLRAAVDTDRDDLVSRTRQMREEYHRIGGLAAPNK
jgi:hypothetical protein